LKRMEERRKKQDAISKDLGQYLLKGWKMYEGLSRIRFFFRRTLARIFFPPRTDQILFNQLVAFYRLATYCPNKDCGVCHRIYYFDRIASSVFC
jgi:hypothetical protein